MPKIGVWGGCRMGRIGYGVKAPTKLLRAGYQAHSYRREYTYICSWVPVVPVLCAQAAGKSPPARKVDVKTSLLSGY